MITLIIFIVIGYVLGSLSPGYLFGHVIKGIDIRVFGNKNTGASNTYRLVGPVYGIIAGIFDALKAVAAYFIAVEGLFLINIGPINPDAAILVGIAAVAGHIWPFYLKFRGGRGAASLTGLAVIILFYTTSWNAFIFIVAAMIYGIILNRIRFEAPARKALKLASMVFPLGLIWMPKPIIFAIVGYFLIAAILFDVVRLLLPRFNYFYLKMGFFAKQKERKYLSGYTLFLLSMYIVLRFFSPEIAIFVILSFIFADILAPIGKNIFLPVPFVKEKTFGGFIIIIAISALVGIFLHSLAPISLSNSAMISGAVIMAFLDQFSFIVDDNILVPIGTAIILALIF